MLIKRSYKNIIESIEGDSAACEIQNSIYRSMRKLLETTFSEMNCMIDYSYKGNRTVIQIEEEVDTELEKQLIEL